MHTLGLIPKDLLKLWAQTGRGAVSEAGESKLAYDLLVYDFCGIPPRHFKAAFH